MAIGIPCCSYILWHPFVGYSVHEGLPPGAPKPLPLPHVDLGVLHGSRLFLIYSEDHKNGNVHGPHDIPFVGRTSDAGLGVVHISPPNALLPLTILLGMSYTPFGASSVTLASHNLLFGDTEAECACSPFPYQPFGLNLACWESVPMPTDLVVAPNTVLVGMSLADYIVGLIDIGIQMAVGALIPAGKATGSGAKKAGKWAAGTKRGTKLGKSKLGRAGKWVGRKGKAFKKALPGGGPATFKGALGKQLAKGLLLRLPSKLLFRQVSKGGLLADGNEGAVVPGLGWDEHNVTGGDGTTTTSWKRDLAEWITQGN